MEKLVVTGGNPLMGKIVISGAKNVSLKSLVAACLTEEEVVIHNVPHISDLYVMIEIMKLLGGTVALKGHTVIAQMKKISPGKIPLDLAARIRTSAMFIAPLLARCKQATIPDPGGDRIGARPIDRTIDGLKKMNAQISYSEKDGYFYAKTDGLKSADYTFSKNTHTGTETLILAACITQGKTILRNSAEEPEVDELMKMLNSMGAKIKRTKHRVIEIDGVEKLHGTEFTVCLDRNEVATFAVAALATKGDLLIKDAAKVDIEDFTEKLKSIGAGVEIKGDDIRFFYKGDLQPSNIQVSYYPGFMTDWQAPWAVLMTQAKGISIIHETVFENRFGYVKELLRMGAKIDCFDPDIKNPDQVYNFNLHDDRRHFFRSIKIFGPTKLHNAVVHMSDLRAGATLVLAALIASGTSTIFGVEQLDRGYEYFEDRLRKLGAKINRKKDPS